MFDHEKKVIKQELKLSHLYDKLIQLYSKDHTTYYFGCPISRTHMCANCNIDIAKNRYTEIMPCMDCRFQCISSNYNEMICKKRFLDLQLSGNTVVQIESKNKDGFINKLSYLDNGTRKYLELPTFIQNITKDVFIDRIYNDGEGDPDKCPHRKQYLEIIDYVENLDMNK